MGHTRRHFLRRAAGLAIVGATGGWISPARAGANESTTLDAKPGTARLAPADYPETPIWGYDGGVPGPTIRVLQGTKLSRRFRNGLPQSSTVHWHGIRLENEMDGVPELTQPVVESGGDFLYEFTAPDAGTFWYHPHERAWEQMARGLYGALVVEEPEPPFVDRDEVLLIDDWRLAQDASIHESFGALGDWSHGGRTGNWITVNGKAGWALAAKFHRCSSRGRQDACGSGPHGPKDAEGVAYTTSKRLSGVRPANASRLVSAAGHR